MTIYLFGAPPRRLPEKPQETFFQVIEEKKEQEGNWQTNNRQRRTEGGAVDEQEKN